MRDALSQFLVPQLQGGSPAPLLGEIALLRAIADPPPKVDTEAHDLLKSALDATEASEVVILLGEAGKLSVKAVWLWISRRIVQVL